MLTPRQAVPTEEEEKTFVVGPTPPSFPIKVWRAYPHQKTKPNAPESVR
ncbi:hypothetical protein MUK42_15680 [Musa troglodytarum]|uniref:Uncharacterized protein n=1 Tax=Musa troglodytarum TaxID=320322 RepID=A0A9E7KYD4_9LILI|nr:hypothetical protein MUK42_15680 [Musa troglodytarum]